VIHQGALGDFILALPALETIRKAFPHAKSVIMGYPRILELVEKRFYADEILSIDQKGMASFFVREGVLDSQLSQYFETFDLIVVFGKEGEGTVIGNLRKSKGVTPEERSKVLILHPGSGSKKKDWPLDRFLNLAHTVQDQLGSRILIVLGPAEGPEVQRAFEGMRPNPPILAKGLTLLQLASVMEGCRFFVGNDSGISHMAAALGLPTVVIFGPTDQRVWSPRGEKTFVVSRDIYCSPCPQERFFQCKNLECLRGIEIGEVLGGLGKIGMTFQS
jgi:heptosyltransferase-2